MRVLVLALIAVVASASIVALPKFNAKRPITVSGLSSGAFMSVQVHVAFSSWVKGAGVFAGGPYDCAQGSVAGAFDTCMYAVFPPNPQTYISTTDSRFSAGSIDNPANLNSSYVFMFSGKDDQTVHQAVMDALYTYYLNYIPQSQVYYENNMTAAHTMPTDNPNNTEACDVSTSPYISDCDYDGAGYALKQILRPRSLTPRSSSLRGTFIQFDQTAFCGSAGCSAISLDSNGWAYVPSACGSGSPCTLHVSFHGCQQNQNAIGLTWVQDNGLNAWADANNIVILYPQTITSEMSPSNPEGCWDWFGYTGSDYDVQSGAQMQFFKNLVFQATK